jgi:hypothetical protein
VWVTLRLERLGIDLEEVRWLLGLNTGDVVEGTG